MRQTHARGVAVSITALVLTGALAACGSSGGGKSANTTPAAAPAGQSAPATVATPASPPATAPATSAPAAPLTAAAGDQSAKYLPLISMIYNSSDSLNLSPGTTRLDANGNVTADGQFSVYLDQNQTTVCLTDTSANVSIGLTEADQNRLTVYSSGDCKDKLGDLTETDGDDSTAKASSNDPTLVALAAYLRSQA
ncbi:MAG: hypothetical protein FWD74_05300 [Actinomycetia bacterium]|nr:hypothetical protein [Actinomycetes bacterium]